MGEVCDLLNKLLIPAVKLNNDRIILDVNAEFEKVSNLSKETLIGINFCDDNQKIYKVQDFNKIFNMVDQLGTWQGELQMEAISKFSWHKLDVTKDQGYIIVVTDITEKKILEYELIDAERRFKKLFESSSDGLILAESKNRIIKVNGASKAMFLYDDSELRDKHVEELITQENSKPLTSFGEMIGIKKNGERFPIEMTFSIWELKEQQYYSYFIRDITTRKKMKNELKLAYEKVKDSNKDLEEFAYIASHDLREPLRMIESYLKLLEKRYGNKLDSDAKEFIEFAVDGSKRMKKLINGLLELSRITTRGDEFTTININNVLKDVQKNLEKRINEEQVVLKVDNMPTINGDYHQFVSLFQNLIDNGIKYNDSDIKSIEIKYESDILKHRIIVQDNGIGIKESDLESIFTIFKRLNNKYKYSGSGVGLAHVKKIVERHNGKIKIESEFGKGSEFIIEIPKM